MIAVDRMELMNLSKLIVSKFYEEMNDSFVASCEQLLVIARAFLETSLTLTL